MTHRASAGTNVPGDTLCDLLSPEGTFYFQVRHANDFNGFPLEILECPDAIRS